MVKTEFWGNAKKAARYGVQAEPARSRITPDGPAIDTDLALASPVCVRLRLMTLTTQAAKV